MRNLSKNTIKRVEKIRSVIQNRKQEPPAWIIEWGLKKAYNNRTRKRNMIRDKKQWDMMIRRLEKKSDKCNIMIQREIHSIINKF